jgi:transcription initiation factor TFIIH subunit 1
MAPPQGSASYKKQNGILAISKDRKAVSWTPAQPPDASPTVVITAASVSNLQQTPETNPKVMLKIFVQDKGQAEPTTHVFTFTSASARVEANAIKDALASVIQAQKAAQNAVNATSSGGTSAAMTIANAISSGSRPGNIWEDDERLKTDVRLQQSLMSEDPALQKTFLEARSLKPDSISNTSFTAQFWSSRVHLLRAHALAKNQNRGTYNVFSTLRKEDGGTKMNLNAEHIHKIFEQYPVMRRVYDETVPKRLNEHDFWSRFFQSKLYTQLRGLKILENDPKDAILDPYLSAPELTGLRPVSSAMHIPLTIDLEGNEENHSQRQGNRPVEELRSKVLDRSTVIRTLNALSEKLLAQVRPSDYDPSAPIGMDEATYEQLRLRDLAGDPEQNRIILKIQDQSRFFSDGKAGETTHSSPNFRKIDPTKAIQDICADMAKRFPQPGIGVISISPQDTDNENNEDHEDPDDPTSISPSEQATRHIMELVRRHRVQTEEIPISSGLSITVYERLTLTHATTIEFLRQFWSAFLSGDPSRVNEVTSLVESLNRAMDRIQAVADAAEAERQDIIADAQRKVDELRRRGERRRVDYAGIGGGAKVVKQLLGPIMKALENAIARYQRALQEQLVDGDG